MGVLLVEDCPATGIYDAHVRTFMGMGHGSFLFLTHDLERRRLHNFESFFPSLFFYEVWSGMFEATYFTLDLTVSTGGRAASEAASVCALQRNPFFSMYVPGKEAPLFDTRRDGGWL